MGELAPTRSKLGAFVKSALGARLMTARVVVVPGPDINHNITVDNTDPAAAFSAIYTWVEHGDTTGAYPAGTASRAVLYDLGGAEVGRLGQLFSSTFTNSVLFRNLTSTIDGGPVQVHTPAGYTEHTMVRGPEPTPAPIPELGKIEIQQVSDNAVLQTFDDIEATDLFFGTLASGDYSEPALFNLLTEDGGIVCPGTGELRTIVTRWRTFTDPTLGPGIWRIAIDYASVAGYVDASVPGACAGLGASLGMTFLDTVGGSHVESAPATLGPSGRPSLPPFPLAGGGAYPTLTGPLWEGIRVNTFTDTTVAYEPATLILIVDGAINFTMSVPPYQLIHGT